MRNLKALQNACLDSWSRQISTTKLHPKISVVTVVRNGMPFVVQTVDSVLAQDYDNLEYIVIDGGSVDGTVDIIKLRQSKIARWISERDEGIADAFNKGLALASGDYILFLNADDVLASAGIVSQVANQILENDFPALIYGDCAYLDRESGTVLHRIEVDFSQIGLRLGKMPPQPSMFSKRSYFEKYGNFDVAFKIAMDFDWFLRGAKHERVVHTALLITNFRSGGISAVNRDSAVTEIIRALRKNGYIVSEWGALCTKSYFFARSILKHLLKGLRMYGVFNHIRSK